MKLDLFDQWHPFITIENNNNGCTNGNPDDKNIRGAFINMDTSAVGDKLNNLRMFRVIYSPNQRATNTFSISNLIILFDFVRICSNRKFDPYFLVC